MGRWRIVAVLFCVVVFGCRGEAEQVAQTGNPDFKVELLFEYDGCRMYRFFDGQLSATAHYYAKCPLSETSTITQVPHSDGKSTHWTESTIPARP